MNRISKLSAVALASTAVLLGAGSPALASAPPAPEVTNLANGGTGTDTVVVGDVNGDGIPDVVSAPNGMGIAVSLGLGDHRFAAARVYAPPPNLEVNALVLSIVLTDVTGDGRVDAVATGANNNIVIIWRGRGDGTFARARKVDLNTDPLCDRQSGDPCRIAFPFELVVADVNHDGQPDIATANTNTDNVAVFLGAGGGRFRRPTLYPLGAGAGPQAIAVSDLDHDGAADLVVANSAAGTIAVLRGAGDETFAPAITYDTGLVTPANLVLADVTGDGNTDAIVSDDGYEGHVAVLPGGGDGRFGAPRVQSAGVNPTGLAVADVNTDGRPDLAVAESGSDTVAVFRGARHGLRITSMSYGLDGGSGPGAVVAADLDGDGHPDLVTANGFSPGKDVTIIWNPGA